MRWSLSDTRPRPSLSARPADGREGPAAAATESKELRPQLNYFLGQVLYKSGKPREALPFFQHAADLNDCTAATAPPDCRRTLLISVAKIGDVQRALRAFDLAVVEGKRAWTCCTRCRRRPRLAMISRDWSA